MKLDRNRAKGMLWGLIKGADKMKKKKAVVKSAVELVESEFSSVFEIISKRRNRALMTVNVESLMTYWEIGAFLSPRIHTGSWSTAIVGRLADYLKRQDPTLKGYGRSNLYSMAAVYDAFSSDEFTELFMRYEQKLRSSNFFQPASGKSLISTDNASVPDIFQPVVGKRLPPKDLGQLEFYLEALDRDVKKDNENPSIGVILCKSANKIVVEYAMSRTMSPVLVAQYKREFIPKEVLQRTFEEYLSLPEVIEEK